MKFLLLPFVFLLCFISVGCSTITTRRITSAQGGGQGELWIVVTKRQEEKRLFGSVQYAPTYEVYHCTTNGCKKIDELQKVNVRPTSDNSTTKTSPLAGVQNNLYGKHK